MVFNPEFSSSDFLQKIIHKKLERPELSLEGVIDRMEKCILKNINNLTTFEIMLCVKHCMLEFYLVCITRCCFIENVNTTKVTQFNDMIESIQHKLTCVKYQETCDRLAKSRSDDLLDSLLEILIDVQNMVDFVMVKLMMNNEETYDKRMSMRKRFDLLMCRYSLFYINETIFRKCCVRILFNKFPQREWFINTRKIHEEKGLMSRTEWSDRIVANRDIINTSIESHLSAANEEFCPVCRDQPLNLDSDFAILNYCIHLVCVTCAEQLFFMPNPDKR